MESRIQKSVGPCELPYSHMCPRRQVRWNIVLGSLIWLIIYSMFFGVAFTMCATLTQGSVCSFSTFLTQVRGCACGSALVVDTVIQVLP